MSLNVHLEHVGLALDLLTSLGLQGEVYLEDSHRTKVSVSGGKVETLEERRDRGLGLRVFTSGGVGFSFATDLAPDPVKSAIVGAREIARHIGPDEAWRLAEPVPLDPLSFPNEDEGIESVEMSRRIEIARTMEKAARATDSRVQKTRESAYQDFRGQVWIASTTGLSASYSYSRSVGYLEVTASEGDGSQVGFHAEFGLGPDGLDPVEVGRAAATKALDKLGAEPASTGRVPAVMHREVVAGLLEALSPAFSAGRVIKEASVLAGKQEETVASQAVHLVDDPRLPGGFGSAPIDGEGLCTRRVTLIEQGRLCSYLHDTYSSAKMRKGTPGNSVRTSYQALPQIGPMNLLLLPGRNPPEALYVRAGSGVFITEVMGLHTVDPISGDFSLGAAGRRIENGRLGPPVDKMAFSGNMLELLGAVEEVGSDLKLFPGGGGAPSILLRELNVAGS